MNNKHTPELLCPCGDKASLLGAISAGADAVYLGLDIFNARIRADNFTLDNVSEAISLCHAHRVKVFVTLNIAIYEREIPLLLEYASKLWELGADALIVSDLGVISLLRKKFPDFEIHASTQCTVHNLDGAELLYKIGCKRVVVARELDKENLSYIKSNTSAEIEAFIHGAHCMSVSGQCLMSYALGGRSGNRGECAQPCRLPYSINKKQGYALSLKDMSLASHLSELSKIGIDSLKIEGRMKNDAYVYGVGSIYRRLLDSGKDANKDDIRTLGALFSRQGFTDGYFKGSIDSSMLGVRSDDDKEKTSSIKSDIPELKKPKVDLFASFILGETATLTLACGEKSVTVYADIVEEAKNMPMSEDDIIKSLSKFGQTPFELGNISIEKSDNIIIRVSSLNALRREAVSKLLLPDRVSVKAQYDPEIIDTPKKKIRTAFFLDINNIPEDVSYFDRVYVYLDRYKRNGRINGIALPPVIFDNEWTNIEKMLDTARADGIKYALVSNVGQIERVKKYGFILQANFRFNAFNRPCVRFLRSLGFDSVIMSPELTLRQLDDFKGESVVIYGKIPVMTTHKCILKDTVGCDRCKGYMKDRVNAEFYTEGIYAHRNVIFNSVPIYMADKPDALRDFSHHFIFTDETKDECENIIIAYKNKLATI
ncbi:MAG: U32 family peptidase, partial [Clostridia bacterium]|nr:U32 family peptidase [Clostridia bacterium]